MLWWKSRKKKKAEAEAGAVETVEKRLATTVKADPPEAASEFTISIEQVSPEDINEKNLKEITDKELLLRVNKLVPGLVKEASTVGSTVAKQQGLYRAVLPAGAKLSRSADMTGAVRGFYQGANGAQGYANFVAVNQTCVVAASAATSIMNLASMVVGQYYMTKIDEKINRINEGITKIADFQNNEYKSKVYALTAQVKKLTSFRIDILESAALRDAEIVKLNALEQQCIEILGQANLTLERIAAKDEHSFKAYEEDLNDAQDWFVYQRLLLELLYRISDLIHTFNLGAISREQSNALPDIYTEQTEAARKTLADWHDRQIERLGVKVEQACRKRDGVDGLIHWVVGLFNDDRKYRPMDKETVEKIGEQRSSDEFKPSESFDYFASDVELIAKDGRIFYLPPVADNYDPN